MGINLHIVIDGEETVLPKSDTVKLLKLLPEETRVIGPKAVEIVLDFLNSQFHVLDRMTVGSTDALYRAGYDAQYAKTAELWFS